MLSFFLHQPDSSPVCLDGAILRAPDRLRLRVEERMFRFQTSQIELTLANADGRFSATNLTADTELFVIDSPYRKDGEILWAGTIDPTTLSISEDTKTAAFRVLQHGSYLNSVKAGKPDPDDLESPPRRFRHHKRADQWRRDQSDLTPYRAFNNGETDIYFTPSALDQLSPTDRLGFDKVYLYDTYHRSLCAGPEDVWHRFDLVRAPMNHFEDYAHPNYEADPATWETTFLAHQHGTFAVNPDSVQPLRAWPVTDLVQNLVSQYNERFPHWPLTYDPAATVLRPPAIPIEINILPANQSFRSLDLFESAGKLFVAVIWYDADPKVCSFTIYQVINGSYLAIVHDDVWITNDRRTGPAFSRIHPSATGRIYFYELAQHDAGTQFLYEWKAVQINAASNDVQTFSNHQFTPKTEEYDYYSMSFANGMGGEFLSTSHERSAVESVRFGNAQYHRRADKLLYSGPLILTDLALEYTDTSLSRILTDLAIATDSIFFITPQRQLIFKSRTEPGRDILVPTSAVNKPYTVEPRTLDNEEVPDTVSLGIALADQHKRALAEYYRDQVYPASYTESKLNLDRLPLIQQPPAAALSFDGTDDYVEVPDTANLVLPTIMTICLRLRRHTINTQYDSIFAKGCSADHTAAIFCELTRPGAPYGIQFRLFLDGATPAISLFAVLNDLLWHTVVFVNTGNAASIYLDNIQQTPIQEDVPGGDLYHSQEPCLLGCLALSGNRTYWSDIDLTDFRLYSRALSPDEISDYHNSGRGRYVESDKSLILAYRCHENRGTVLHDWSDNRRHAKFSGPSWIPSDFARPPAPPSPQPYDRLILSRELPSLGPNPLITSVELDHLTLSLSARSPM